MGCFVNVDGGERKLVTLTFMRDQLLYDIENYAHVESHVMDSDGEHAKHMVADVGDDGNVDRVTRVLDLGVSMCRELLFPWSKEEIGDTEYDDVLKESVEYRICLSVPSTISQTTLSFVERQIHEYLVCRGVGDWLSMTNPVRSATWFAKAAEAEQEIRTSIHSRLERMRIRGHWLN